MEKEVFKRIIGFPDYEISNIGTLISYKNRLPLQIKICKNLNYRISNSKREQRSFGIGRLIFAAFNNIHPDDLNGKWICGRKLSELKVYTREEHIRLMQRNSRKIPLTKPEAIKAYKEIHKGLCAILNYFETGDPKEVFSIVYSYSSELSSYIRKRKFAHNNDVINEAIAYAQEECIVRCLDGSTAIADLEGYMRAVIRSYFKKDSIHRIVQKEYKEHVQYFY